LPNEGLRDYLTTVRGESDQKMGAGDPDPAAAGKGDSPQGVPLQGDAKILSTPTALDWGLRERQERQQCMEAIAELLMEEEIGALTDGAEAPFETAKLQKENELQYGKNAGSGAGIPTAAALTSSFSQIRLIMRATSPSLHPTALDPIRTGRAGKYGDTVAPGREESASSDNSEAANPKGKHNMHGEQDNEDKQYNYSTTNTD
jgi:hypothetical protein